MQIQLTSTNQIRITNWDETSGVEFDAEFGSEVIHGITVAMAEAGRREVENPKVSYPCETILKVLDDQEVD